MIISDWHDIKQIDFDIWDDFLESVLVEQEEPKWLQMRIRI